LILGILLCAAGSAGADTDAGPDVADDQTTTSTPPQPGETPEQPAKGRPEQIVVRGRADSLVGEADSASEGTVGAEQLEERPLSRPGEVLEAVPGVIVTQHSGDGKANQYFLRGFNLDHGTDFATSIDGVPINLPTHGHGQGYTDLNFLIPELIRQVNYKKGVYYADEGDFSSAGAANIEYYDELPANIAQLEGGMFSYARSLLAGSTEAGPGRVLAALELLHNDGPWVHDSDYRKVNGVLRFSSGDDQLGYSLTASAYAGRWSSTDQIAERAVNNIPDFGRFDSLDKSDAGRTQKYMLYGEWHRTSDTSKTQVLLFGFYQNLELYSNFTYFLDSPNGDQFEQTDRRGVGGTRASQTWFGALFGREMENTVGFQLRSDSIENGLFQTVRRNRTVKVDYAGDPIPSTTRQDDVWELSAAPYLENRFQWAEKVRSIVGVRLDYYHFDVDARTHADSGVDDKVIASPKGNVVFGPWADTELYLSAGMGFHSNDARGVTAPVDAADPLVRSYGAEVGVRTAYVPKLHSTLSFWWLDLDSELVFAGDAGTTEATRPSRRYGIELANYYEPLSWLTLDADVAYSWARFRDHEPEGDHIPGSVVSVVGAGATVHRGGFLGALRLRYFGPRPLIEDDSVHSGNVIQLGALLSYELNDTWKLSAEVFNLLNRKDNEIEYYYPSRFSGEPAGPDDGGYNDIHLHPVAPISFRAVATARF
jgi:hypothetical protein